MRSDWLPGDMAGTWRARDMPASATEVTAGARGGEAAAGSGRSHSIRFHRCFSLSLVYFFEWTQCSEAAHPEEEPRYRTSWGGRVAAGLEDTCRRLWAPASCPGLLHLGFPTYDGSI